MDRNDLAAANQQELIEIQGNQAYSIVNEMNTTVTYEEISLNRSSGEVDMFHTQVNEAYQTNTAALIDTNKKVEVYTKANEAYQTMPGAGAGIIFKGISLHNVNGQPNHTEVPTEVNIAYQTSAAVIESEENEAYGICITSVDFESTSCIHR